MTLWRSAKELVPLLILASAIPLASCAGKGPAVSSQPALQTPSTEEAVAIASALAKARPKAADYKLSPGDLLEITVYREEDLRRVLRVSQQGTISFPLVGVVEVGGNSVTQAEERLSARLKDYLIEPQLTIFVKEYGNKQVFVLGEVTKPGSYPLPTESPLTVLEAVSLAGGFTQIAAPDRTRVIRTHPNGTSESLLIEVSAITKRGEKHKDMPLQPSDVIYVPQSFF